MTRWGIGPKFGAITAAYALAMYLISDMVVSFDFPCQRLIGIALISFGTCVFVPLALTIGKHFKDGTLRTKGAYSVVRHPIYASWVLLIIPGAVIWWGCSIGLTVPVVSYLAFRRYIGEEDEYLFDKFGAEFDDYRHNTNAIFPRIRF